MFCHISICLTGLSLTESAVQSALKRLKFKTILLLNDSIKYLGQVHSTLWVNCEYLFWWSNFPYKLYRNVFIKFPSFVPLPVIIRLHYNFYNFSKPAQNPDHLCYFEVLARTNRVWLRIEKVGGSGGGRQTYTERNCIHHQNPEPSGENVWHFI